MQQSQQISNKQANITDERTIINGEKQFLIHNDEDLSNKAKRSVLEGIHYCEVLNSSQYPMKQKIHSFHSLSLYKQHENKRVKLDTQINQSTAALQNKQFKQNQQLIIDSRQDKTAIPKQFQLKKKIYFQTLNQILVKSSPRNLTNSIKKRNLVKQQQTFQQLLQSSNSPFKFKQKALRVERKIKCWKNQIPATKNQFLHKMLEKRILRKQTNDEDKKSQDTFIDDSIEYVNDETPGPGNYTCNEFISNQIKQKGTFSKSARFQKIRPMTSLTKLYYPQRHKQQFLNSLQQISFGTNKIHPRSQIKKVQYCDWARPHFYQNSPKDQNFFKQNACFSSAIKRFQGVCQPYKGPDYVKQNNNNKKKQNQALPSHYFLSNIAKGVNFCSTQIDNRDFLGIDQKNYFQKIIKSNVKTFNSFEKAKKQYQQKQQKDKRFDQQGIQYAKNALLKRKRKPNFLNKSSKIKNKQNIRNVSKKIQNYQEQQFPQQNKIKQKIINSWIVPSFNKKFQKTILRKF